MQELIKITEKDGKQAVSARELYVYLTGEVALKNFTQWSTRNININDMADENVDYQTIRYRNENGRSVIDYAVTIDFAKELCMLSQCKKGKEARIYFIQCEKKLKEVSAHKLPQTFAEALQLAADQAKKLELQEAKIQKDAPKVESFERFIDANSLQGFKEVANLLGLGRNTMMKMLREMGILTSKNIPYQKYLDRGYFEVKESTQNNFNVAVTYVTPKGIDYLKSKLT